MWLVRFRMREPRPLARAYMRFIAGPSSTKMRETFSSSTSAPRLFSALATAESSTLRTRWAAFLLVNWSTSLARPTGMPRTRSATRRAFCAEMRALRRIALASVLILLALLVAAVALEGTGHRELAELVPDHVLVDQYRHVLATVVDGDGQAHHFGQDHRAARPGLDRTLVVGGNGGFHLLCEVQVDERTFLQGARHDRFLLLATTHNELLRALVVAGLVALGRRAPRADRVTAAGGTAFTTAVRMVDRVHHHAAHGRADALPALGAGLAQLLQAVLGVADFADGGAAVDRHAAHFAGAQTQRGVTGLARDQLHGSASTAGDLCALACLHLDAVDGRTDRDGAQRQAVAGLDRRVGTGHQAVTHRHALGRDDVAALAVG